VIENSQVILGKF
jgi:hypothetical protein